MKTRIRIGLVGDRSATVVAHQAIPVALELAAHAIGVGVQHEWLSTDRIDAADEFDGFDGLWCVPGGPYRSMTGALTAIRHARESGTPLMASCAGFQHVVIEWARNVLGWVDADHSEVSPNAARAVVSELSCGLLEGEGRVQFQPGSRLAAAYGAFAAEEEYLCRFGLNPEFTTALIAGPLRATATDAVGEVRAVELDGHRFFVATLFQGERSALRGRLPPLTRAFVHACLS
jgi:CTP synthase (UTP-ammonia lyase)